MERFEFYQDEKCTIWFRTKFYVEAENEEEAQRIVEKACNDVLTQHDVAAEIGDRIDSEYLFDTAEGMDVSENKGYSTLEVYDVHGDIVGHNGKI